MAKKLSPDVFVLKHGVGAGDLLAAVVARFVATVVIFSSIMSGMRISVLK